MKPSLVLVFGILAVGACQRSSEPASSNTATTNADASSSGSDTSSDGGDSDAAETSPLPMPRAGLWSISTTSTPERRRPNVAMQVCTDGTTPPRTGGGMGRRRNSDCQPQYTTGANGLVSWTSDCTTGRGAHVVTRARFTGDNQTAYQVHLETNITGAPIAQMNGSRTTEISARYVGACPSGMNPGDMSIGGRVITREMMREMRRGGLGGGMGGGMGGQ